MNTPAVCARPGCTTIVRNAGHTVCGGCRGSTVSEAQAHAAEMAGWRELHTAWAGIVPLTLRREAEERRRG